MWSLVDFESYISQYEAQFPLAFLTHPGEKSTLIKGADSSVRSVSFRFLQDFIHLFTVLTL